MTPRGNHPYRIFSANLSENPLFYILFCVDLLIFRVYIIPRHKATIAANVQLIYFVCPGRDIHKKGVN